MPDDLLSCRRAAIGLLLFVLALSAFAQNPRSPKTATPDSTGPEKTTPPANKACSLPGYPAERIREVVDASAMMQPPLAADSMIRIAAKVSYSCPALAKALLNRAFEQSDGVKPETSSESVSGSGNADTNFYFTEKAYSLHLDRLSLQSRVVIALEPIEPKRAVQLFRRISPPRPGAITCADAFAPDVSLYYAALSKIQQRLRSERSANSTGPDVAFQELEDVVATTTSPVQLLPLADAIQELDLAPSEVSSVLSAVSSAIDNFPLDDNSFFAGGKYPAAEGEEKLVTIAMSKHVSASVLTHSFHNFLQRSLNGTHCENVAGKDFRGLIKRYRFFNGASSVANGEVEALTIPSTEPPREAGPAVHQFWQTPKGKQLLNDAKRLNSDDNGRRYTEADRKTPEWQDRVRRVLDDLDGWNSEDEPDPASSYHERCVMLNRVLDYLVPGPLYDQVVAAWTNTFSETPLQWDNLAEWYLGPTDYIDFLNRSSFRREFFKQAENPDKPDDDPAFLNALLPLQNSSNPYVHAFGMLADFIR
jgi:hypothetical protein